MDSMHHIVYAIWLESSDIHKRNAAHFLDFADIGSTDDWSTDRIQTIDHLKILHCLVIGTEKCVMMIQS